MSENLYTQTNALLARVDRNLRPGEEHKLGAGISIPHGRVRDTALAACLATIGIPLRDPAPYTHDVALDDFGNVKGEQTTWWLGDIVPEINNVPDINPTHYTTEWLGGAWIHREKFEAEHPAHPLVPMRRALDARSRWCARIHAWHAGAAMLPIEVPSSVIAFFHTDKISAASVLEGMGFAPLAFHRRTFFLAAVHDGRHAEDVLLEAAQEKANGKPAQWMANVLRNYSEMVKVTKSASVIVREPFDGQTLLLTADVERKTRDRFLKLV